MPCYDVSGNPLSSVYDVSGNVLSALYDVHGNVIQDDYEPVDINDIPSYWHQEIYDTLDYIDGFNDDYVHYLIITDSHIRTNESVNRSADIANYLMENGNLSKLMLLGDNANAGTVNDNDYLNLKRFGFNKQNQKGKLLALRGNHESGIDSAVFHEDFMSNSRVSHDTSYNWMIDDHTHKIRIVGMAYNFSPSASYIGQAVDTLPTGYSLLVLNHINFSEPNSNWEMNLSPQSSETIITVLRESEIPLIGYWCGHQHLDESTLLDGNIYHTTFMCDLFDTSDYYEYYTYPPRRIDGFDSMTGQALTVASVNTKTHDVQFLRVGNCHNSEYKTWGYTYGVTIPDPSVVNLDIVTGIKPNVYLNTTGAEVAYNGWSATDYIDVSSYSYIRIYTDSELTDRFIQNYCYWYDENKSMTQTLAFGVAAGRLEANETTAYIPIPEGSKYFRLSDASVNLPYHIYVSAK